MADAPFKMRENPLDFPHESLAAVTKITARARRDQNQAQNAEACSDYKSNSSGVTKFEWLKLILVTHFSSLVI